MLQKMLKISDLTEEGGVFTDGDWVESKDQDPNGDVRLIQLADIGDGEYLNKSNRYLTSDKARQLNCTFLAKGDLLVARMPDPLGRACIFPGDKMPCVTVVDICIIRPNREGVQGEYLKYLINNTQFRHKIRRYSTGTTRKRISRKNLNKIKFELPDPDDQIRIASVLSKAESLISKRKESIRLLDDLLKSTFLEMFGPAAPGYDDWPSKQIKDLAKKEKGSMRTGPFGSNLLHSEFTKDGDVAVLGIDNAVNNCFEWSERRYITSEKYEKLKNYTIYPRDVIITIMGTNGRSAVIPDDIPLAINTKHLAAITFDENEANPHFMSYAFHSSPLIISQLKRKTRGAIMGGLNLGIIKRLKVRKPPIELQKKFVKLIQSVESLRDTLQGSLSELENLYGSLSQRAFRGELDLSQVPVEIPAESEIDYPLAEESELADELIKRLLRKQPIDEILDILSKRSLSFPELWNKLEESKFVDFPDYDEVKSMIVDMLEDDPQRLSQIFDEERKRIVLGVEA